MKKLLFVATAALCATVFGAIESTNVVGYQNKTVNSAGFTLIAPTFAKVDKSAFTLRDLGAVQSTETVQFLDEDGATLNAYVYFEADFLYPGQAAGWYTADDSMTPSDSVVVQPGTSLLFESQGTNKIVFSGTVAKEGESVTTGASGFSMIGNGTPVGVKIADIQFVGIQSTDGMQLLNSDAGTETAYVYFAADFLYPGMEAGWYTADDNMDPAGDVVIEPGDGLLFEANNGTAVTVTFPAAL